MYHGQDNNQACKGYLPVDMKTCALSFELEDTYNLLLPGLSATHMRYQFTPVQRY